MARGELTSKQAARVHTAVAAAEAATGVELCVAVMPAGESDPSLLADAAFADLALASRRAALVVVMPDARRIELRVSPGAADVLTPDKCERVVYEMRIPLVRGAVDEGVEAGMRVLTGASADTV